MKLKEIRKERGVEQLDLALKVGTNAPMMSKFEHYKCLPIPTMLRSICEVLHCERSEIYDDDEIYLSKNKRSTKTSKVKSKIYYLSVRLPERARKVLAIGNLNKCGYHSLKDFIWHCFVDFEKRLKLAVSNEKTAKHRDCLAANEDGNIPKQRNISINHLSIKINR